MRVRRSIYGVPGARIDRDTSIDMCDPVRVLKLLAREEDGKKEAHRPTGTIIFTLSRTLTLAHTVPKFTLSFTPPQQKKNKQPACFRLLDCCVNNPEPVYVRVCVCVCCFQSIKRTSVIGGWFNQLAAVHVQHQQTSLHV